MAKNGFGAQVFIDNMPGTGGIVATLARRVGCDWHTAKKYIDEYPTVRQAYDDECENVADLAESVVIGNMNIAARMQKKGEMVSTADAKWWLTKKRKPTFGDAVDITSAGEPITFRVVYDE